MVKEKGDSTTEYLKKLTPGQFADVVAKSKDLGQRLDPEDLKGAEDLKEGTSAVDEEMSRRVISLLDGYQPNSDQNSQPKETKDNG